MYTPLQTNSILEINNLSKRFREIRAVDDLSLTVLRKDIYGFIGPNGSGKSTTIRMILTLIKPDHGQIRVFGLPLNSHRKKILVNVGSFIEKPDFYEYLSAYKNMEILSIYSGIKADKRNILELLDMVGLKDRSNSSVKTFSKGMKQRLGIAQALLHDPELLILDEPSSGLDPSGTRDMRDLIRMLNEEKGKTIILSSHNLGEIEMIANRMVIIKKGKKVIEGDVKTLLKQHSYLTNFIVDNAGKAAKILQQSALKIEHLKHLDVLLQIQCTRNEIPEINSFLVTNGIRVESIKVEQNLEDYFLNMT
jgi:ABC-type multidrug transport system ATPase subunit